MRTISGAFERWLFDEYQVPSTGFGLFRILYASVLLVQFLPSGLWLAELPAAFLLPPPGFTYFSFEIPSALFFQIWNFVLVLAAVSLLFGWHTRLGIVKLNRDTPIG